MKQRLMEILACPIDKYYPLELYIFEEDDEIIEGLIRCTKCSRWFPIRGEIPELLPDELREKKIDINFLKKWKNSIPQIVYSRGKPFNLGED